MLDVNKMDAKQLENMITRILKSRQTAKDESDGHCATPMIKLSQKYLPNVTLDRWMRLETVCAIKLSLGSLSFAQMNKEKQLLDFGSVELFKTVTSVSVLDYQKLYAKTVEVADALPKSDIYVFEEIPAILPSDRNLRLKVMITEANYFYKTYFGHF